MEPLSPLHPLPAHTPLLLPHSSILILSLFLFPAPYFLKPRIILSNPRLTPRPFSYSSFLSWWKISAGFPNDDKIIRFFYRCLQLSGAADVHHVDCGFWTLALSPRDGRRAAPPPPPPPPRLVYPITIFFSSFPIKDSSVNLGPNRPNHHHRLPTNQSIGREKEISNR